MDWHTPLGITKVTGRTANQALQAAQAAQACCDATNQKLDRMFEQRQKK
jgi:hypothetical protein